MAGFLDPSIVDLILSTAQDIQSSRYASLASSAIIVYDHFITLDQEIKLVWRAPWTMGKLLFLLNRYYPLFNVIFNNYSLLSSEVTDDFCINWFRWQGFTALVSCMIAEVILQIRLYALYFLDKKILVFMLVGFLATSVCSATIIGYVLSHFTARAHLIPGLTACIPIDLPDWLYAFWIPILVFESLLCGMALFRGFQAFRYRNSVFQSGRRLVTILLRDSIIYYLIVFVTYLANLILFSTQKAGQNEIATGFAVAMSCVMGNRLILNVRHMKREMEASIDDRQLNILHLPFTANDAHGDQTPSLVIFAPTGSIAIGDMDAAESAFEMVELGDPDMRRGSRQSHRPVISL